MKTILIWILAIMTVMIGWAQPSGYAMLAPTTTTASDSTREADMETIQRVLENKIVRQRLEDLGFTGDEINAKVENLSDAQVHQMAAHIDALMPGGNPAVLIVVAMMLIGAFVVLYMYVHTHQTDVDKMLGKNAEAR